MFQSRWAKIALIGALGLLLGGGGAAFLVFASGNPESLIRDGEAAHEKGVKALEAKDFTTAAVRCDEANLQATKALELLDKELGTPKERTPEQVAQLNEQVGQAFWLKARALRDAAFARAESDGKPIKEVLDSTTGERFRSILSLPDRDQRNEAFNCLVQAAIKLPGNATVQNEALRLYVMLDPIPWNQVEQYAERVVKLEPNNPRAHFLLARYHFEQPIVDPKGRQAGPTQVEKRKIDRVTKAREHVEKAKDIPNAPYWRTLDLETKISTWLRDEHARNRKTDKAIAEQRKVRQVLLDDKSGVLVKAQQDSKLPELTIHDVRGALSLHLLALQQVIEDSARGEANADTVLRYLDGTLDLCQRLEHPKADRTVVQESAAAGVQAILKARPALSNPTPANLDARVDRVQTMGQTALERKVSEPHLYAQLALLAEQEGILAGKQGKKERRDELDKRADQWIADGIKAGEDAKLKPEQLAELHALAAQRKALRGDKPEQYEGHLKALRDTQNPAAVALATFIDGVVAERSGRLEKARKLLEQARNLEPADLRTNLVLGTVYMALNDPTKAQACLQVVARRYNEIDKLSEQDRNWMAQFMRSREELDYLLVIAHLGAAEAAVREFLRENPGKQVPGDRVEAHEQEVTVLLKKLPARSPRNALARYALVSYLVRTGRKDQANKILTAAQADHPGSLELLQLEIALMDRPASKPGKPIDPDYLANADRRIRRFLAESPQETRARLFWAAWLADTGRADKAIEYLENPTNFPTRDEQHQRVLALAQLRKGDRAAGLDALKHLPSSANVDAALVLLSPKPTDRKKQLEEAMSRHEQKGLLFCLEGALYLSEKKYAQATESYFQALEFNQVRPTAQAGFQRAAFAFAQEDPAAAQKEFTRMIKEAPEQPILYLAYAVVCIHLGDIGHPTNAWERVKNMSTALNVWEQLSVRARVEPVACILTRAECYVIANRFDLAQEEIVRALRADPKNVSAITLAVGLALDLQGIGSTEEARKLIDKLKEIQPDNPVTVGLESRVLEREGKKKEAVAVLEAYVAKNPDSAGVQSALHFLLNRLGETDKAIAHSAQWRKTDPEGLAAIFADITSLAQAKQLDKAVALARETLDKRLKNATEQADKVKLPEGTAKEDWDKQKKEFLSQVELGIQVEIVRALLRGKAYDEADKWLLAMLAKEPGLETAMVLQGDAALGREEWKKAAAIYEDTLKKHPKNVVAANNLAWLLAEKMDDTKRAFELVEKLRRNPITEKPLGGNRLRPEILDTVGVIFSKLRQAELYPEMKDLFAAACNRYPSDPRMYLFLGHAQVGLKQPDQAKENFSRAVILSSPEASSTLSASDRAKVRQEAEAALKQLVPPQ